MSRELHLPTITVQHDLPDVVREIRRGDHAVEDCWTSIYRAGQPSVHGKMRLREGDTAGLIELEARDGVDCELLQVDPVSPLPKVQACDDKWDLLRGSSQDGEVADSCCTLLHLIASPHCRMPLIGRASDESQLSKSLELGGVSASTQRWSRCSVYRIGRLKTCHGRQKRSRSCCESGGSEQRHSGAAERSRGRHHDCSICRLLLRRAGLHLPLPYDPLFAMTVPVERGCPDWQPRHVREGLFGTSVSALPLQPENHD